MKKIINPYAGKEDYNCFGCSPNNQSGLKMEFFDRGEEVVSFWEGDNKFEGFHNVLHGGIQATLMDEIASWVVFVKLKTGGMTTGLNVRYLNPVLIDKGSLELRAKLDNMEKNIAHIAVSLFDGNGVLCSEGIVSYFTLPEKTASSKLRYPGIDSFFE